MERDTQLLIVGGIAVGLYLLYQNLSTTCGAGDSGLCSVYNSFFGAGSSSDSLADQITATPSVLPAGANVLPASFIPQVAGPAIAVTAPTASQTSTASSLIASAGLSENTQMTPEQWDYVLGQIAPSADPLGSLSVSPMTADQYVQQRVSAGLSGIGRVPMTSYVGVGYGR